MWQRSFAVLRCALIAACWLAAVATLRAQTADFSDLSPGLYAEITTNRGTLLVQLDFEHAPLTVANFVGLAEGTLPFQNRPAGSPFFDGLTWHRVVKDFVIQGGDPLSADPAFPPDKLGDGGPGYAFPDEFGAECWRHDAAGMLSMANDGPDTNGSQIFITLREVNRLNYLHSVFGRVIAGAEVLDTIVQGDRIERVRIHRAGVEAIAFRADAAAFETLKKAALAKRRALRPSPTDFVPLVDEAGKLPDFRVKNFNFKLANYERATGHRLAVRIFADATDEHEARTKTKETAASLGLPDEGDNALICYYVGSDVWKLRLGEALYPALFGRAASTPELMHEGALHRGKETLLAGAQALSKTGKLKEAVDAAIDTLILRLDDFTRREAAAALRKGARALSAGSSSNASDGYGAKAPGPDGIGKSYFGREIAQAMGHTGADWLDRPERETEERTDLLIEELRRRLKDRPDAVIADIGAGSGYFTQRLAPLVPQGRVLAEDIDPEMLKIIQRKTQRRRATGLIKHPNVETILGTTTDPKLPEGAVDFVLLVDAYHEFDHPREMMAAIVRALKPGGQVIQLEFRAEDPSVPIKPLHKMTAAQARKEMETAGLMWKETLDTLPQQHLLVFEKPK